MRQATLSSTTRVVLALLFAILIAVKMPDILLKSRFWAEEGNKFFQNAWLLSWYQALFAPWGGYLNITANVAGLLAWYVPPLEWAPYASTLMALVFQTFPAVLLLTSQLPWLQRPWAMVVALLLVVTPVDSDEIWLSSIGTQCHLTLCAALILACSTRGGVVGAFRLVLLFLAAMSGPGPWLLTPLFAARAAVERSSRRAVETCVLGSGVLLQVLFFYSHEPGRAYTLRPLLFLDVAFDKHVLLPFLGPIEAFPITRDWYAQGLAGHLPWWPAVAMAVIIALGLMVLARDWRREPFWMAGAAAVLIIVSYLGSLGGLLPMLVVGSGGRYTFAPEVLIGLALLSLALTRRGLLTRIVAGGCVAWMLFVGLRNYRPSADSIFAHGPGWRTELALHRRDPHHVIASWPPGWQVPLPPQAAR